MLWMVAVGSDRFMDDWAGRWLLDGLIHPRFLGRCSGPDGACPGTGGYDQPETEAGIAQSLR